MLTTNYEGKTRYQEDDVVTNYERFRFHNWRGKIAHQNELRALKYAIETYFTSGSTILDVPCGTGRLFEAYRETAFQVSGADISAKMLAVAQKRFKDNPRFTFQECDAEALPFGDAAFDYLVSYRFMAHLPPDVKQRVFAEMLRVTRQILVINYHLDVKSPLMLFNRMFPRMKIPLFFLKESELRKQFALFPHLEVCEIRKLSWYERSSAIVILRKRSD